MPTARASLTSASSDSASASKSDALEQVDDGGCDTEPEHSKEQDRISALERQVAERTHKLRNALAAVTEQAKELTESRQRELALHKSVFAGRLAVGLAHEFNSPMACVLANQNYLLSRLDEIGASDGTSPQWLAFADEARDVLNEDHRSVRRVGATVATLQGFSAAGNTEVAPIATSIHDILRDTRDAIQGAELCHSTVQLDDAEEFSVCAHSAELSMALLVLIQFLQEHEALPEGEAVLIEDAPQEKNKRHVRISAIAKNGSALISLHCDDLDTDLDEAERAFDPSLVTAGGNRVRLSIELSICAARIARSGGSVCFCRSPDGGTIIEVRLMLAHVCPLP